ncbi:uncharacterized protein LOC135372141 [Ornithodoros turicata]|uniref:uncharacterized protein LOC135372141 n=1 Tax=Ornithodoros turicata TaxID=34597 RepID=UPI003139E291
MNRQDYINEGLRQLSCTSFYENLDADPTERTVASITKELKALKSKKEIDATLYEYLLPRNSTPGRFYMLPKIHKEGNPGRPIVSCNATATEKISSFVDHVLKDIPPQLPSYIKDTNHFLQILNQCQPPTSSFLVTLDVSSLYTNISHEDGIIAVETAFSRYAGHSPIDPLTLSKLVNLILKNNNFEFDSQHYLQISGTAMGTKMAPTYANIFMGTLEEKFLEGRERKQALYKRYLDDIFMIWPHSERDLIEFINDLNQFHPTIKFTHTYSTATVNFLDVQVNRWHNFRYMRDTPSWLPESGLS